MIHPARGIDKPGGKGFLMKKQVLFSLILAVVLLLVPVGALAADGTPEGKDNALSSNGAEAFTITTKDKLDSAATHTTLTGFTEGAVSVSATVACWKDADGNLKFVYLSNATELTLNAGKTANLSGNVNISHGFFHFDCLSSINHQLFTVNAVHMSD